MTWLWGRRLRWEAAFVGPLHAFVALHRLLAGHESARDYAGVTAGTRLRREQTLDALLNLRSSVRGLRDYSVGLRVYGFKMIVRGLFRFKVSRLASRV